jgi:lysophospholipase L1-like esterase
MNANDNTRCRPAADANPATLHGFTEALAHRYRWNASAEPRFWLGNRHPHCHAPGMQPRSFTFRCLGLLLAAFTLPLWAAPATLKLVGDWEVEVAAGTGPAARLQVSPTPSLGVTNESYTSLPLFNPKTGGWSKGVRLRALRAQETTTPFLLEPASLRVCAGAEPGAVTYQSGRDYQADLAWGTLGRLTNNAIGETQAVLVSYRYTPQRLDAVVLTAAGKIELRPGEPRTSAPQVPGTRPGEQLLATLWLPGSLAKLAPEHLFPVLETAFPEPPKPSPTVAEQRLPQTLKKLRAGQTVRVLAWGDSVTDGGYLPNPGQDRWQEQFAARLRARFPQAKIELVSEAWGGRNSATYLAEPPGSPHNYREKVLAPKPDLIVSEFVNDAGLSPAQVAARYGALLKDFQAINAEWIILTPHYVRPDWMGLNGEREIDDDPRPYVAGLRAFSTESGVALADASLRWGRLWRQGVPYTTLLLNSINHPNRRGMGLFADALMELFP